MKIDLWTMFEICINIFQGIMVVFYVDHVLAKRRKSNNKWMGIMCGILFSTCCTLYIFYDMPEVDTWIFLFPFVYSMICFRNSMWEKIFWNIVLVAVFLGVANLTYLMFLSVANVTVEYLLQENSLRVIFVITSNVLILLMLFLITRVKENGMLQPWAIVVFIAINILSIGIIDVLFLLYATDLLVDKWVLLISSMALGISLLSICLHAMMSRAAEREYENKQKVERQRVEEQRIAELRNIYASLHGLRHDLKNQIEVSRALIENGNIEEGKKYLNDIEGHVFDVFSTGCLALDSQLTLKVLEMKHRGIEFRHCVTGIGLLPITDYELCSIVGNLLDNSVEAISRSRSEIYSPHIALTIKRVRDMLYIECVNPVDVTMLKEEGGVYFTMKKDKGHGMGIRNIKSIVKQAEGFCSFTHDDGLFTAMISIPYRR